MTDKWVSSSQGICIDGVNSAVRPDFIGERQLAWMINGTVRDGKPRTRIGLVQRLVLPTGKVQGAGYFSLNRGKLILSIGGTIHRVSIAGSAFSHDEIELSWRNSAQPNTAWMQETVGNFIIQDGESAPIIFDGGIARRSDIFGGEVPIGRMMAFGNGRLWVVIGRRTIKAGDIYTGKDTELNFIETQSFVGGGAYSFPLNLSGLAFLPVNNTASGYGSLIVFARERSDAVRAEITSRDLWQIIPGFVPQILDGVGTTSHHSITPVNQDLYWRDADGQIRSLRSAAQDAETAGNAPISREVSRITDHETNAWLDQCSGIFFDNRLIFTAAPVRLPSGQVAFTKLLSLDCAPLATMRGKASPAYDGEWTGLNVVRLITGRFDGRKRAFAIAKDGTENSLWEFVPGVRSDSYLVDGASVPVAIQSAVEFRKFDFGTPGLMKQLSRCDIYPSDIEGEAEVSVYWRVANRNQWLLWGTFTANAKMTDEEEETAETVHAWKNLRSQERGRVKSLTIPDSVNAIAGQPDSVGLGFQLRIVWTGNLLIDAINVWARPLSETNHSNIPDLPTEEVQSTVQQNELVYTIKPTS